MATRYTLEKINQIHRRKQGVEGKHYTSEGRTWVGDDKGRLVEITGVVHNEEYEDRVDVTVILSESNEERITDLENNKADKCYALAMSIIL
jgi:hypothetical protein